MTVRNEHRHHAEECSKLSSASRISQVQTNEIKQSRTCFNHKVQNCGCPNFQRHKALMKTANMNHRLLTRRAENHM
eukprot:5556582-Amphidinium_carterae.1